MAWRQSIPFFITRPFSSNPSISVTGSASFSSKSTPYLVKVGIPEFLNGVGKGVEAHVEKLESEIGDLQKLLVTRTLKLKKLGIPCKQNFDKTQELGPNTLYFSFLPIMAYLSTFMLGHWKFLLLYVLQGISLTVVETTYALLLLRMGVLGLLSVLSSAQLVNLENDTRKLILKYAHKYRVGLWRPRAAPVKS